MQIDDPFRDRQAQAKSAKFARDCRAALFKRVKNARLQFWRDTHTAILNLNNDVMCRIVAGANINRSFARRELHRVIDQIPKNLLETSCVSPAMMFSGL